jgi:hypothetical protein
VITYDGVPTDAVSIMDFTGDLVTHETQYFADPFQAPAWRAALAEPIPARDRRAESAQHLPLRHARLDHPPAAQSVVTWPLVTRPALLVLLNGADEGCRPITEIFSPNVPLVGRDRALRASRRRRPALGRLAAGRFVTCRS